MNSTHGGGNSGTKAGPGGFGLVNVPNHVAQGHNGILGQENSVG